MSDWRGHLKFGYMIQLPIYILLLCLLFFVDNIYLTFSFKEVIIGFFIFIISPLIPDLDHRSSKITNITTVILLLFIWISMYITIINIIYPLSALTLVVFISTFIKHRGITHNVYLYLILGMVLFVCTGLVISTVLLVVGALSHIWLDKRK